MKLLAEISEGSLGLSSEFEQIKGQYKLRKSARAILLNDRGEMATQYLRMFQYHKLPGGGIKIGESNEEALKREIKEEVGCECEIVQPVGISIEYHNVENMLQISYCFVAKVSSEIGSVALEENEIEEGQETHWLLPEQVLKEMKSTVPLEQKGYFILKREISFLEEYLRPQAA